MNYNIKDMVKDKKKVTFVRYRRFELWYTTECGFDFPVPIEDTGDADFFAEESAMLYMRYIRKHIKVVEAARAIENEC